jgi:branched-chain amino acid transport system substrate-binding protein
MRKMMRVGMAMLAVALAATACGSSKSTSASSTTAAGSAAAGTGVKCSGIKIGYLGALSGENGQLGQNMVDGANIAIDEWNAANKDCQITLVKSDSQGDPKQATPLADTIVQDKSIVALLGPGFSGETKATMSKFEEAGLPIISPSATNAQLQNNGWKSFHRILANDDKQAPAVSALIKSKGAKKVGVVDDASEYGKGLADGVRKDLGALKVADDQIDPKASDYSAAVNKMKAAGVDYVFYGGYYAEAAKLVKQLRGAGVTATFVSGDGALDQKFVDNAGKDGEGALLTATGAPPNVNPEFQKKFNDRYKKDPTLYAPESYDIVKIYSDALSAGKQDRKSILEFLGTYDKPGVTKQIKFDSKGEVAGDSVYSYVVQGGKIGGQGIIK